MGWTRTAGAVAMAAVVGLAGSGAAAAQDGGGTGPVALAWELSGEAEVIPGSGGTALRFRNGAAALTGVGMDDGVIRFRARSEAARSFVGWRVRVQENAEHEHFYFRPHKSDLPDALQYAPYFPGGRGSEWQLFHGPGGTGAAPVQDWTDGVPMALVLSGDSAAWFIGHGAEPVMVVPRLAFGASHGGIEVASSVLAPTRSDRPVVIDEIEVVPGATRPFAKPPAEAVAEGTVGRWSVGEPWLADGVATELPDRPAWHEATAEPDGTLLIHRTVDPPAGQAAGMAVVVGLRLRSPTARTVRMEFGFSDAVTVFLNGRPILTENQRYSFGGPDRMGLLVPEQTILHLPLEAGDNELVAVVTEFFGGWAVAGRLLDGGVEVGTLR